MPESRPTGHGEIRPGDNLKRIQVSLTLFRIMAIIAGVALLILCVELVVHYGFDSEAMDWWPQIHGYLFIIFVVSVFNLGFKMRWTMVQMCLYVLTAFVPVLSFLLEHRVNQQVGAQLEAASASAGETA